MMNLPWDKHPLVEKINPMKDSVLQVMKRSTLRQIFEPGGLHNP
jgi:hypothetical protein